MPTARYESKPVDVSPLAQPLKFEFSGRVAKNRLFKAAMVETIATWHPKNREERGIPTKELIELYRRFGEGGWGIITTGNMDIDFTKVSGMGDAIITPECPLSGPRFEAFQKLAAAGKAHGSLLLAQVSHPGRQLFANISKDTISASAVPMPSKPGAYSVHLYATPREATKAEIAQVVDSFAYAAVYLQEAGFDGIQLHGAHGYLISQFLSERTNQRTDEYGGSIINRVRIVTEIAAAIRARVKKEPGFVMAIKINSVEFQDRGITAGDAAAMCELLEEAGFDLVELSGGNHEDFGFGGEKRESTRRREAYFLEFVRDIAPLLKRSKSYLVGGFRTAAAMVEALGVVDGISLGRPAAQQPTIARDLLEGRVTGAVRPPPEFVNDSALAIQAAGAQMRQMAKGVRVPADLGSDDENKIKTIRADIARHAERLAADGGKLEIFGFADLTVEG
ncbi:hypothetical protein F5X99DRAFT_427620 [Biscogniauxia marginata]|nr:hypothetical protein F5X99DRAFT_427620 [Biscogniauxia marginata]